VAETKRKVEVEEEEEDQKQLATAIYTIQQQQGMAECEAAEGLKEDWHTIKAERKRR
jgi:hypothetical protein